MKWKKNNRDFVYSSVSGMLLNDKPENVLQLQIQINRNDLDTVTNSWFEWVYANYHFGKLAST